MLKKINKLVGLKKTVFDDYVANNKIILSKPKLIPPLKTKSEIAITSILLSSLRLVKEFRYEFFKEIKLKKSGKVHFYTEVCFKDIDSSSRIDGLIIVDLPYPENKNFANKCKRKSIKDILKTQIKSIILSLLHKICYEVNTTITIVL